MVVPNWRSSFFRPFADNGIFAQFGILVGSVLLMLMGVAATLNDDTKMSRRQFARQAQASAESQARHDAAEAAAQAKRDAENELNKKKSMAWRVAQRFVSERLKSPSTASFGSLFVQNHETCVKAIGNDQYNVRGWVDSQNAFGATVRVTFALTVTDEGRDKWTLDGEPIMGQR
jgi:Tfp pilus assembly protein PilX